MSVQVRTVEVESGAWRVARWLTWSVCVFLCAVVALVSYRYLFSHGEAPPVITNNVFKNPWLVIHVAGAATALLIGPLQFSSRLRARFPQFHRLIGRTYVVSCLVGGVAGFVLALGATTGPISTIGFGSLAVLWIASTSLAWRRAMQGRFVDHRAWMIRSFAFTFAAVTLRLYLPLAALLSINFVDAYIAISFLCWLPNLAVAELYLRNRAI
ncbi:MAG TPA: DUF2306 domain-containing protein [Pyrinomonadaceae bacterium]|nr:DUF2306 domain-containing protein [Pyrinomonadaceae bacterium]